MEDDISEHQVGLTGRHREAQVGQVMQLAEGPGEVVLPPLWPGDNQNATVWPKVEVVGHDRAH